MSAQYLKCGCVFDGKSFTKYCRKHGLKLTRTRWEKQLAKMRARESGEEQIG